MDRAGAAARDGVRDRALSDVLPGSHRPDGPSVPVGVQRQARGHRPERAHRRCVPPRRVRDPTPGAGHPPAARRRGRRWNRCRQRSPLPIHPGRPGRLTVTLLLLLSPILVLAVGAMVLMMLDAFQTEEGGLAMPAALLHFVAGAAALALWKHGIPETSAQVLGGWLAVDKTSLFVDAVI